MHQFKQIYSLLEEFKAKFEGITTPEIQVLRSKKIRNTSSKMEGGNSPKKQQQQLMCGVMPNTQ